MKITQGKWEVDECKGLFAVIAIDDEPICMLYLLQEEDHHYQEFENAEANAILIAEAPETRQQRDELQKQNDLLTLGLLQEKNKVVVLDKKMVAQAAYIRELEAK